MVVTNQEGRHPSPSVATDAERPEEGLEERPEAPLRVLFVSHTYVVGINQGKLSAIAREKGAKVGLLVPAVWQAKSWGQVFELERDCSQVSYFPAKIIFNGRTGAFLFRLGDLLRAIKEFSPDVLQVEEEVFSLSTFQLALVARLTRTPLAVFGWENLEQSLPWPRRLTRKFVLKTARLVVAGNQDGAELLRGWGYTGRITVMPQMGVDTKLFSADARRLASGDSLPTDRPFRIGFMGRLVHDKGIDLIFDAARQLKAQGLSLEVILCGSGTEEDALRAEAERQGIAQQVIWKGKVPHAEVPLEMAQFDALVLPSRTVPTWKEQFGHVLIEAMSMGIPVIGSSSGEIPHVIGCPDWVFSENDAEDLAQKLHRIMADAEKYQVASEWGKQRVAERYTHESIAQKLMSEWRSAISDNQRGNNNGELS